MIAAAGDIPLLIEGPDDADVVAEVMGAWRGDHVKRAPLAVARGLGVGALAALLLRCAAYVGNDSGVAHLAGLLGLPTVSLFGPTDPAIWAPLGRAVWPLRAAAGELARLAPAQVAATLALALRPPAE
jgi:heptosyltransferase-2